VERVAFEVAILGIRPLFLRLLVDVEDALERRLNMRPERIAILDGCGREETPPQQLGHVLFHDRLHRLLALALEDVVELALELAADVVALCRIAGQERRHDAAAVDLGGGLGQVLKEVEEPILPPRVRRHLFAGVHQHLVDQDQDAETVLRG